MNRRHLPTDRKEERNWNKSVRIKDEGRLILAFFAFILSATVLQAQIVFSEIMYKPSSSEDNWEWVELYNASALTVNLAGYVLDDSNGTAHGSANIASGTIPPGGTAILYNVDDVTAGDFAAAWGPGINLVPTTNWGAGALNNGGDKVGLMV